MATKDVLSQSYNHDGGWTTTYIGGRKQRFNPDGSKYFSTERWVLSITLGTILCLALATFFASLGDGPRPSDNVGNGHWTESERFSSLHQEVLSCPNSGIIIGAVWNNDGEWRGESHDTYPSMATDFISRESAKRGVEKFVKEHNSCSNTEDK